MWLYFVMAPNPLYCALAHLGFARHRAHAPSDSTLRRSSRSFNDQRDFIRRKSRFTASSRRILESPYSVAIKPLSPLTTPSHTASNLSSYLFFRPPLPSKP